ncbi:hypothetical protein QYZ88_003505 [Lachnospiraceae bacterium C1.1]|nr:hypothetical protein [Lachnospiraceae bacterium C1.1]
MKKYKIADFVIEYHGDSDYMHERFGDFACDNAEKTDMTLSIVEKRPFFPRYIWNKGTRMGLFHIYWDKDCTYQYFPHQQHGGVRLIEIKNNFKDFTYYICDKKDSSYVKQFGANEYKEYMQGIVFNFLQQSFYNMILFENAMSVHSASVIYHDKALIFSAPSGTGKSTQAEKWMRLLGCECLDGDVTVCREIDGKFFVYGLPWCGSSGIYLNKKVEVGAFVFLKQASENTVRIPSVREKIGYVFSSTFSEGWNDEMNQKRSEITGKIIENTDIYEFACNLDDESVEVLRREIF